jgi:hypothetical protein
MPKKSATVSVLPVMRELSDDDLSVIVEAARQRAALVSQLREALMAGDDRLALEVARKVCGLEEAA